MVNDEVLVDQVNNKKRKIVIHKPYVKHGGDKVRLLCDVNSYDFSIRTIWFEVEEKYGQYLCWERSDAFLIGLLSIAMREGCDIVCEAPVTAQLLYQIRTYLIPSLVRHSKALSEPRIIADMEEALMQNAGGVGTGISCGVDSMHAVMNYANSEYPGLKLTHLVLNNVGAFYRGAEDRQYEWQAKHAKDFCDEYGFELILTNSNFAEAFPQNHLLTNVYSSCFAVYAMQKLWNVYFYASVGTDFSSFSLEDNEHHDSAYYDLLSLDVFSNRSLKIYSEGGAVMRFDKMRRIVDYSPSYKYLHVCVRDEGPNCGTCSKCMRTLTALDALDRLNDYKESFDIEKYYANYKKNMLWLYLQQIMPGGDKMTTPAYEILSKKFSKSFRLSLFFTGLLMKCRSRLSKVTFLKRMYDMFNGRRGNGADEK